MDKRSWFVNGRPTGPELPQAVVIDLDEMDRAPAVGEADSRDQPDVAGAQDADHIVVRR